MHSENEENIATNPQSSIRKRRRKMNSSQEFRQDSVRPSKAKIRHATQNQQLMTAL